MSIERTNSEKLSPPLTRRGIPGVVRRRFRRAFTREKLVDFATTMLWVVPTTLLIWVYAEREQQAVKPGVRVLATVIDPEPNRVVRLLQPANGLLTLELTGPRSNLDAVAEQLNGTNGSAVIGESRGEVTLSVGPGLTPGKEYELDTENLISDEAIFRQNGISVTKVSPPRLTVYLDEIVERKVPPRVDPAETRLAAPPTLPASVVARGPAARLKQLADAGKLVADLDLKDLPDTSGPHALPAVKIKPIEGVQWIPATLAVDFTVAQRAEKEYTVRSMVVNARLPMSFQGEYVVKGPDVVQNVTVTGPAEAIDAMQRPGASPPIAVLAVTPDDINRPGRRRLTYANLPAGVRAQNEALEVPFEVVPAGADDPSKP